MALLVYVVAIQVKSDLWKSVFRGYEKRFELFFREQLSRMRTHNKQKKKTLFTRTVFPTRTV